MAKFWKTSGECSSGQCSSPESDTDDPVEPASPDPEELEHDELELDDPVIDEAALPELDTEDAEVAVRDPAYDDLLDRGWLERAADDDRDDEASAVDDIGLTIELDTSPGEEESAHVLELDVGSLLTSLPSEGEVDLEPGALQDRGDPTLGVGALGDVLLPDDESDGHDDDREVGDDERFPVFDADSERQPRGSDDEVEIGPDDLS